MRILPLLCLLLFAVSPTYSASVEVTLTSGEIHIGELTKEDDTSVTIAVVSKTKAGKTLTASITHQRSKIATIREVLSLRDQYAERLKTAGESPDSVGKVAVWCLASNLYEEAITQARRAWTLRPGQGEADQVLTKTGHIKVDGQWVLESEHLAADGKVKYRDEVLTKEEAAKRKEVDNARVLLVSAREQVQELEGRERKALKGIEEESMRKTANDADATTFDAYLTENRPRVGKLEDRIRSTKAIYDQAVAFRFSEENIYGVGRANPGSYQSERAAQDALNAERNALQVLITDLTSASSKRDAALRSSTGAQQNIVSYQKTVERARTELVSARTKLSDLESKAGVAGSPGARSKPLTTADVPDIAGLRAAVVLIATFDAQDKLLRTGSGFFVSADGRLITNRHVSGDNPTYSFVVFWDPLTKRSPERFRLSRVAADPNIDLACLLPVTPRTPYGFLVTGPVPELATPIRAIGFPAPDDLANILQTGADDIVITGGTVNSVRRQDNIIKFIQHDCRIASGNSGGPLIDASSGRVIGINTFGVDPQKMGAVGDTFFFAIPASQLSTVAP